LSSLKRNIKFNIIGQSLVILLGFVSIKYIYAELGSDALGIIYFSLMLSAVFTAALDMGLSKTTIREVAAYNDSEPKYIIKLSQTFSLFYWLAYVTIVLLFILLLPFIVNSWINLTTMELEQAYDILLIIGSTSLLAIPKIYLTSICIGMQRIDANNIIDVTFSIIQQFGMAMFLINGKGIYIVAYWLAITSILKIFIYMVFVSKILSIEALIPKFSVSVIKRIKDYTVKLMWVSLLLVVHKQIDKVLISKFLPIANLGIYMFAFTSISKASIITGSIAQAAFPYFSDGEKNHKKESLKKYFQLQDILIYGTVPVFILVFFLSKPVFTFLLDEEMSELLQLPVLFLTLSFYFNATLRMMSTYVSAIGKPEYLIDLNKFLLIFSIPISIILIYKLGMLGAAISWVYYYTLGAMYIVPRVYRAEFNYSPYIWFRGVGTVIILICLIYVPSWYMAHVFFPESLVSLIFFYSISTVIYSIIAINLVGQELQKSIINNLPIMRPLLVAHKRG
jgi:O-antigen/teichoic acid export membrane protein